MKLQIVFCLIFASYTVAAESISGKVIGITDGDTLTLLVENSQVKNRLSEIDTPEKGQPWGKKAKNALSKRVAGKDVVVDVIDVDRYGRTIGKVW